MLKNLPCKKHACHIRMGVIEGTHSAGCGHPGGSLSIADVLSYLYFKELNVDPVQPRMADRDRLVLSKGHAARRCTPRWQSGASSRWRTSRPCARSAAACRVTPT